MDVRSRFHDPVEAQQASNRALQSSLWTAVPCTIVSVDRNKQTCHAQPTVKASVLKPDGSQEWQSLPLLQDAPLHFPGGGGVSLTFPVGQGDEALAIISSRAIDAWHQSGGEQVQPSARMHDLSDAFILVGFRSQPNALPNVSDSEVHIRTNDGNSSIALGADGGIKIKSTGSLSIETASGLSITGNLTVNGIDFMTHVHGGVTPGGSDTTGPH